MTVQCLSRVVIGVSSTGALQEYQQTTSGENYAATLANHNAAWHKLCAVYGHDMPRTNMDRIEDVLTLVEVYQGGHNKTGKKYLQQLDSTGFTHTTIPYHVAEPIIGTAARAIDRLDALLCESEGTKVGVNFTGGGVRYPASGQARREGAGGPACTICKRPGHVANDCLVFMEREGVCKRWFMHDVMHKWEKGCEYENCKYKHARRLHAPRRHPRVHLLQQ